MVIGITGSSGAGKSTVCEILESDYNAKIITADKIAKELSKKGTSYLSEIVDKFGIEILLESGELNRKKLANIIYHDSEKRNILNSCTFKYIYKEIEEEIKKSNQKLIAIDAPLLFEAKLEKICDVTIAVVSEDREIQILRIIKRDGIDREHAIARLNAQYSNDIYIKKCDKMIVNNEKIEDMKKQIAKIILEI